MHDFLAALGAPVHSLPLELVRIWTATVVFVYFLQAYRHAGDFSDPDGLIDHRLCAKLLPATRWSLFQPGMSGRVFRAAYLCACAAAVLVALGVWPRACALFLFAVAVSTYRWNALVSYLDDCIVHLFCLWLVLLPVGHGASLVPGAAPRAFMANMALIYLVAGAYKFTSPMWRNGTAIHAALKTPISRTPGFWTLRHRSALRVVTYAALILEPLFGLVFVLPTGSPAKWLLAAAAAFFHLGIVATLRIPYANFLMLGGLATAFGPELADAATRILGPGTVQSATGVLGPDTAQATTIALDPLYPSAVVALTLVVALAAMFAWEAVGKWRPISRPYLPAGQRPDSRPRSFAGWANPLRFALWLAGIFQSYRLFDWVDSRNYHVRYEVWGATPDSTKRRTIAPHTLFPGAMRHLLLQSYLFGNVWLQMTSKPLAEVRKSILVRYAARYARTYRNAGTIEVWAIVQRVTPDNLDLARGERRFLMRFTCRDGAAEVHDLGGSPAGPEHADRPPADHAPRHRPDRAPASS